MAQLVRLLKCLTGQKPYDDKETALAFDFNGDGKLTAVDATLLKRILMTQK